MDLITWEETKEAQPAPDSQLSCFNIGFFGSRIVRVFAHYGWSTMRQQKIIL
jgi:hypothetical protein